MEYFHRFTLQHEKKSSQSHGEQAEEEWGVLYQMVWLPQGPDLHIT